MADNDDEFEPEFASTSTTKLSRKRKFENMTAEELLPQAMIGDAIGLSGIRNIKEEEAFCLVVQSPSPDWTEPLVAALKSLGEHWDFAHYRLSAKRPRQHEDLSGEQTMNALTIGGRCVGVAHDLSLLPAAMITAADMTIILKRATPKVVNAVIKAITGQVAKGIDDQMLSRLDFGELAGCIRLGTKAKECVDRIRKAAEAKRGAREDLRDVPPIEALHGYGAAKEWAMDLIEDLAAWRRGEIGFDAISANVVLSGPPGTGKTTYVRSLARSTGLPLVATSVGAWFSNSPGYLDSIIKQIDQVFEEARACSPAILFLDEIDAVPNRANLSGRGADWWLPVITHLLTTMDGAISHATDNLIVIGATNHGDKIDPALVRPGRLSRIIDIELPDEVALAGIFRQHLGTDLDGEDLMGVARFARGSTGAVVAEHVKTARRRARRDRRPMEVSDLMAVVAPHDARSPDLLRRIAIHEAGHAALAHATGLAPVLAVSVVASEGTGGFTLIDWDGRVPTREAVEKAVVQTLGGRAAEEVVLGAAGTGSGGYEGSDLAVATRLIAQMHLSMGLGATLLFRAEVEGATNLVALDDKVAAIVEADLQRLYAQALEMAGKHRALIEATAEELLERRHIGAGRFLELIDQIHSAANLKESVNG